MPVNRWIVCFALVMLAPAANAADLRTFSDANLHAVRFLDEHEGWAVGDQGTVWHTMDGGAMWERQPTGTRATLTDVHVEDYRLVWISARESLPYNPGSAGIVLNTEDGGIRWNVSSRLSLSGLQNIFFFDDSLGWGVGETSDQHPAGVFFTNDGGKSWNSIRGARQKGWTCAWFPKQPRNAPAKKVLEYGVLGGHGGSISTIREGVILPARVDWLPGATVRDIDGSEERLWVVGDQSQIFYSENRGASWSRPKVDIPVSIQRSWDFHSVSVVGDHVWAVGRPGSVVLHSWDGGESWEIQKTGQPLPLSGVHFVSATHGWAVGAMGTILHTADGGKSWEIQRPLTIETAEGEDEQLTPQRRHAAMLWLTDTGHRVPLSVVARYGGEEGYYCVAYAAVAPDLKENLPALAARPARFSEAFRLVGGAAAETSWKYPLSPSKQLEPIERIVKDWDRLYEGKAAEEMERDLVLAIRMWQPEIVVTGSEQVTPDNPVTAAMVALGARHAFESASDPESFPEQIELLGLQPHSAKKLYGQRVTDNGAVVHSAGDFAENLGESFADAGETGMAALAETYAAIEQNAAFELVASRIENGPTHRKLTDGVKSRPGDEMRRAWSKPDAELQAELRKNAERKRNLIAIADRTDNPAALLAQLKGQTADLSALQAGHALFQIGQKYVERGQWHLAHPVFEHIAAYHPEHPLALEAYRWLIAYQTSSEARKRSAKVAVREEISGRFEPQDDESPTRLDLAGSRDEFNHVAAPQQWNEVALVYGEQLRRVSGQLYADPRIQLCLASAHRQLGNIEMLNYHYNSIVDVDPASRWDDVIALEKWFFDRQDQPPRPVAWSVEISEKPYLDGNLDDDCWTSGKKLVLQTDDRQKKEQFETTVYMRHDKEFLYLAAQCASPGPEHAVEQAKRDGRDADLSAHDRIELFLDLDRDYNTYYRLQVDRRGLTAEDCWGDKTWNPQWYVAVSQTEEGWSVEAAIPLADLTDNKTLTSATWAFNVARIVPGETVLAWSLPATAEPRPEGFSFLKFVSHDRTRSLQPLAE